MLTDILLKETENIWEKYYSHPFVKGIEDGTLDKEKFKFYMIQDYLYLIEYTKVFAIGIAKSKSYEILKVFASYINAITEGETKIHRGYMKRLGISLEEIENTKASIVNTAYTSYMQKIAYDDDEVAVLAAILSCAYSYEKIAKNIYKNNKESVKNEFYGDWIKGYISEDYAKGNVVLIDSINKLSKDFSEEKVKYLTEIFVNCSLFELKFWDMSYEMKFD